MDFSIFARNRLARGLSQPVRWSLAVGLLMAASFLTPSSGRATTTAEVGRLGQVEIDRAEGQIKGSIIAFSDPRYSVADAEPALRAIAEAGYAIAAVDSAHYLTAVNRSAVACARIGDDIAPLLPLLGGDGSASPPAPIVLVGSGAGGAIAYAALSQARSGEFAGAIGFQFDPNVPAHVPFCANAPVERTEAGFRYPPNDHIPGWWRMATENPQDSALQPYAAGDPSRIVLLRAYDDLASAVLGTLASEARATAPAVPTIDDLPLVLLPTQARSPLLAIIYSGDGGWRDLDKEIGLYLQAHGIPVVGFDTLRYFWDRRTPAEAATSLRVVIDHFTQAWNAPQVLLIGYSFGADVLPFAVNGLPEAERARIRQVSLLGLSQNADFEIHVRGWLGAATPAVAAMPIAPQLPRLDPRQLQCFYGIEEKDETACVLLTHSEIIETEGGHHFGGDYDAIARRIIEGLVRRGALPAP